MDKQTLNYSTSYQTDPFSNVNEGTIGDLLGRFYNPHEISDNFPIRFNQYPLQFGSDRVIVSQQPTTQQESNNSSLLDPDSVSAPLAQKPNSRKRKPISTVNSKDSPASSSLTASNSKVSGENCGSKAGKRSKHGEAGCSKDGVEKCEGNGEDKDDAKPPEPLKDYIHVRARRGQATDSHSLAERARREKISERMTLLQDLVPGCNRITGKAVMLDEIINYVQSLQRQVEFLSMKLATINPRMEFNANASLSTEMNHPGESLTQSLYAIACSEQRLPTGYYSLGKKMPRFSDNPFPSSDGFVQAETPRFWENDLQSIVQMGFGDIQQQSTNNNNNNCSEPTLQMKIEP